MNANLKAASVCFIVDKVCSVKCLVVNNNVNNVYLMTLCSMSRSLLLQFSSHQFFRSHWSYWYKKPTEVKETFSLRGCSKNVMILPWCYSPCADMATPVPICLSIISP